MTTPEEVQLREVHNRAELSPVTIQRLVELHEQAFPPEEQQFTMELMLDRTGADGFRLLVATLDEQFAGYLFLQVRPQQGAGFLWYMAIEEHLRNRGIGGEVVRQTLAKVRREDPQVQIVLLESHRSNKDDPSHDPAIDARRIELYRRLGAWHARGIDYGLPAKDAPSRLLHYEILFFSLRGLPDREQIRETISGMMRSNFPEGDERVQPMLRSLEKLELVPPP